MKIGILSDTHGTLHQATLAALQGAGHIIHAGDIGDLEIIDALRRIAPVTAVRGNTDTGRWAQNVPETDLVTLDGVTFYVLHDLTRLDLDPPAAGIHIVVSGHTHQPEISARNGVFYMNPGSASQRRRHNPLSVGRVTLNATGPHLEIVVL